ncbi:phosphoenolpyruvate--protein phosphotransferase [Aggregicoccus sp. 17bor-14]|uniref:phosphoenolpyruvate--protein phosphotransferase n=1 Tax=Myxococcaceae TaxID=31 RepID=UPI00129C5358|nr:MULTISPECIES: phosphoenolpyruvate--protein phosphotransferase [Myxococcaceae]MBF5043907.1 phosphoenolpyruvate--protein phosphotransferase [Simulacricoccus sp. 17bor-14]MRI89658.1 phosphoenolpyruvate--protein phosphotransferase [Aggregicoccus sp. 17bor-14]
MLQVGLDDIRLGGSARDRDEAIALVGQALVERGFIAPGYVQAMLGRERQGSTLLGHGIAIPHGLPEARDQVHRTGIVVVQFPDGVPWGEGGRAHLAVGIAARSDEHIQVLANLTGVLGDAAVAARLAVTTDPAEVALHLNGRAAAPAPPAPVPRTERSVAVRAPSPHGLHARPATLLVATARRFQADVSLRLGERVANAKSVLSLLRLGAAGGCELTVSAEGPDAEAALQALVEAFARGLGDGPAPAPEASPAPAAPPRPIAAYEGRVLAGVSASPGIAAGPVWHFKRERLVVRERAADPAAERLRLQQAQAGAAAELRTLHDSFQQKAGEARAAIFRAHGELLADPELAEEAQRRIAAGESAGFAWRAAYEERAAALASLHDPLLAARAGDLRDVGRRVLRLLADEVSGSTRPPDHPVIIVAEDLEPSDTAKLDPRQVLGLCTASGGATSHTAIIARSLDLPAVAAVGPAALDLPDGLPCILDGDGGVLVVEPTEADLRTAAAQREASARLREEERRRAYEPALTTDGVRVEVGANISAPGQAQAAVDAGAEGIGLMRTEFLFLERDTPPGEQEQLAAYEAILSAFNGLPVILRTMDIGGDKAVPYLDLPAEANPFLGVRGLRLSLQRPDLLRTQLRAILRASRRGLARVMFPMVTSLDELLQARAILEEVRREVGAPPLEVGIMIEVPAAVVMADQLAQHVDFFSIGTNDLTQYVLAMDRLHPVLAPQADGLHPAVLRMVRQTVEAARGAGIWVGACGGIAGEPAGALVLAGLGVTELSVSIPSVAAIKAKLRSRSMRELEQLAQRALQCRTAAEVRALLCPPSFDTGAARVPQSPRSPPWNPQAQ